MADFNQGGLPFPKENEDELGIGKRIRRKKSPVSLAGIGLVILVIVLVIGSFWVSFYIGKKILTPKKMLPEMSGFETKLDEQKSELPKFFIPEKKVSKVALTEKKKEVVKKDPFFPEKKKKVTKKVIKTVAVKPVKKESAATAKTKAVVTETEAKLFKVQVMVVDSKDKALEEMKKLEAKGMEVYANDTGDGKFSVQAGAFKNKANALKIVNDLKAKGFSGKIISE